MADADVRFTDIDLGAADGIDRTFTATAVFGVGFAALVALFCYDYWINPDIVAFRQFDWPLAATVLFLVVYALVPLVHHPRLAKEGFLRLAGDSRTLASFLFLLVAFGIGLFGPLVYSQPEVHIRFAHQPPVGLTVPMDLVNRCLGPVANGRCFGTWQFPLGTAYGGFDVLVWLVHGLRVVVAVALVSGLVVAGVGTAVGALAGYAGGRVDDLLMRYVDAQQVIPAFLVYVVLRLVFEGSLFALVFIFGLLNWGGTARLVRSETRSVAESGYVTAARAAGASRFGVVRSHVVPNVAGGALTSATNRVGTLVLAEASLSFLALGPPQAHSLGRLAAIGLGSLRTYPWVSTIPVLLLAAVALALGVVGEGVRAAFDPRV